MRKLCGQLWRGLLGDSAAAAMGEMADAVLKRLRAGEKRKMEEDRAVVAIGEDLRRAKRRGERTNDDESRFVTLTHRWLRLPVRPNGSTPVAG